jgi:Leishmanolysin
MPEFKVYHARANAERALAVANTDSPFVITVRFVGGLTDSQQDAFARAADRWATVIVGDLPDVEVEGDLIDDVLILAEGAPIDGVGNVLGQAGPTHVRVGGPPCRGVMRFDTDDLSAMEAEGTLVDVITHEMGHVLGIGTLWEGLVQGAGGDDPRYTGRVAMVEYGHLTNGDPDTVPVENRGGDGSRDSHWRDELFGNELMTSAIAGTGNPISRLTVASLIDLGYQVDLDAADAYELPTAEGLAAFAAAPRLQGHFTRPERHLVETTAGSGVVGAT